jgi:hypothetical protein
MTDRAVSELERAAADCETVLGTTHPDSISLRADLAGLTRAELEEDDDPARSTS